MKRILTVALTVALALSLAATAYAGELQLGGKEAGAEVVFTNGGYGSSSIWIKVGSVDFVDGSFKFHLTDLKVSYDPSGAKPPTDTIGVNLGYGKWYAVTGGDGIQFTLSNDKARWVAYPGYMKPTAKLNADAKFLATATGTVAGVNLAFNALESGATTDMNLAGSTMFGDVGVAGFIGAVNGTRYFGGDLTLANALAGGTANVGVFANSGNGLAYIAAISGVNVGQFKVEANYKAGNDKVMGFPGTWKDGNIPGNNTATFFAKASTTVDLFEVDNNLAVELTNDLKASTTNVKVSDSFTFSNNLKNVAVSYEFKSAANDVFKASATIVPGVAGLELYPALENEITQPIKVSADAKFAMADVTLYGGLVFKGTLQNYYGLGLSNATFGNLDTSLAGMYFNDTAGAKTYTRAYGAVTTDISETITGVGLKALYANNTGVTDTIVIASGNYAMSADTNLNLSYLFREKGRFFAEIKKTIGSATFALSYGGGSGVDKDDASDDVIKTKFFDDANKYPWHTIQGSSKAGTENTIKARVTVGF